jgi:hypothetical protein
MFAHPDEPRRRDAAQAPPTPVAETTPSAASAARSGETSRFVLSPAVNPAWARTAPVAAAINAPINARMTGTSTAAGGRVYPSFPGLNSCRSVISPYGSTCSSGSSSAAIASGRYRGIQPAPRGIGSIPAAKPGYVPTSRPGLAANWPYSRRPAAVRRASVGYAATPAPVNPAGPAPFGGGYPHPPYRRPAPVARTPYLSPRSAYLFPVWLSPWLFGDGYGYGSGDTPVYGEEPQDAAYEGAPQEELLDYGDSAAYAQASNRPAYIPEAAVIPSVVGRPEVTLLYKDGRPEERIQNYALSRATLYVLDGPAPREILLDQLDIERTEKANREAGIDFQLPAPSD